MLNWLKRLFAYPKGICRYCDARVDPNESICFTCWGNNSAW